MYMSNFLKKIQKKITGLFIIIKVKAVSPSPFYDGKYHPPLFRQLLHCFTIVIYPKLPNIVPEFPVQEHILCTSRKLS